MDTFTAATLNIWQKFGPWEERMPRLRSALAKEMPDVIGLQEVRVEAGFDQLASLNQELAYHAVFGATFDDGYGKTGNGILSRWEVLRSEVVPLPTAHEEWRCLVFALLDSPYGKLPFFTTHLNWQLDDGASRRLQVRAITGAVAELSRGADFPAVLVGDFNAEPDSDEMRYLRGLTGIDGHYVYYADAWVFAGDGSPGTTYSKSNPFGEVHREAERRIDYVYVRAPERGRGEPIASRVAFTEPVEGMFPTDHYGVVATIATGA